MTEHIEPERLVHFLFQKTPLAEDEHEHLSTTVSFDRLSGVLALCFTDRGTKLSPVRVKREA